MKSMSRTGLALVAGYLLALGTQAHGGNHAGAKPGFKPIKPAQQVQKMGFGGMKPDNQKMGFGGMKPDAQKMRFPGGTRPDFAKNFEEMKKKQKERDGEADANNTETNKPTKENKEKRDKAQKK